MSGASWARRVLVVEDQRIMRVLVAEALRHRGFEVELAADAAAALELLDAVDPDVLVTDVELGSRPDGVELAVIARAASPGIGVVVLSNYAAAAARMPPGAEFVDKATLGDADELVAAIERAARGMPGAERAGGERRLSAHTADLAAPAWPDQPGFASPDPVVAGLTPHQRRILALVAAGLSNAEIAERTGSTVRAVERTVSRLFDRLEIANVPAVNPRVIAANRFNRYFGPAAT
ncbi:response regulator [Agromyces mediolanus]|uniref:response regulator n=1 Tax=Agromyces mediolanus TaxID=41986 RepID=UPI00383620FF